jgi:hypothetical protein
VNLDCFVAPSGLLAMTLPILSDRNTHQVMKWLVSRV